MKFKQFLQESPFNTSDWVEENDIKAFDHSGTRISSSLDWIKGTKELSTHVDEIRIGALKPNQKFEWLLTNERPLYLLSISGKLSTDGYDIENFKQFPTTNTLHIMSNSTVESLDGIEKLGVRNITFGHNVKMNCGLLRFLKCKSLKNLAHDSMDKDLQKAFSIIRGHLNGDRDIVACQNELIDAGLDDWAKL